MDYTLSINYFFLVVVFFFSSGICNTIILSLIVYILAVRQLDLATSGKGGIGSFIGVCVISATFGLADANVQGGMIGDLSLMRPEFVQVTYLSICIWSRLFICVYSRIHFLHSQYSIKLIKEM